jgi:TonB-linked SusC/RagA family outer membrane protein
VLKDAASSSIYGSRAANGVIIITTKRGSTKESMSVTYNGRYSSQMPTRLPELVDGATFMVLKNEGERNNGRSNIYTDVNIQEYKDNVGKEPYFDTNWFDQAMKSHANEYQNNLTIRGGSEKLAALVSLSDLKQDALVENADYTRRTLRFNTDYKASNKLSFAMDGSLYTETAKRPTAPGGGTGNPVTELFRMMTEIPAIYPAIWSDGTIGEGWNGDNPLGYIQQGGSNKSTSTRVVLNIMADYKFTDWLNAEIRYNPKYYSTYGTSATKQYTFKRIDGSTDIRPSGLNGLGNSYNRTLENNYRSLLKFNKTFGNHTTSAIAGFEATDNKYENFSASRQNFLLPQYEVLDGGDENYMNNGGNATEFALVSYFGRVNYSFKDKYLFEANLRYDGSSRFASEKRWGTFPSFSAGWRITEEEFMKNMTFLSNLKIRASWGKLGNQNIGNYPYLGVVSINQPYYFGKTVVQGAAQTVLPNANVTWETTTDLNFGLDFGFFNNRLSGSLDVYNRTTKDILYKRDIPSIVGLSPSEQNIAEVENKGWDLQLSWDDKIGRFDYGVDFVVSDVRNKVLDLNGKPQYGRNIIFENEEYQAFYGYECIGIYRSQEDLDKYPAINTNVKIGDLIYKDISGPNGEPDGVIDANNDKIIIGSNIPRYNFGVTFNFAYKGFDMNLFFQGVGKKDLYYLAKGPAYGGNYFNYQLGRLIPDDPSTYQTADWPRIGGASANEEDNNFYLYDAAYIRCKSAVLGYTIPSAITKKISLQGVRLYVSGQNLFTIDNLKINTIDPEAPSSSTGQSYYPNTKVIAFGLDVKF